MTTSEPHRGLLIVNTGDGKGKSTAAFGTALRGWARGWSVGVFQFVKSGRWQAGERAAFEALAQAHAESGAGGPVEWQAFGAGFTWLRATRDASHAELARQGWDHVAAALAEHRHDLYVLDEFSYPLARGWVDAEVVLTALAQRPGVQHVVITGRDAPPALVAVADLVTDMRKVKHPYDTGIRAEQGLEW